MVLHNLEGTAMAWKISWIDVYTLKVGFQMDSAIKYKEAKGFKVNPFRHVILYFYIYQIINLNNCDSCIRDNILTINKLKSLL